MGELLGILYLTGFSVTIPWVYKDARRRKQSLPMIHAAGVALIFPVGIFVYLWMRE